MSKRNKTLFSVKVDSRTITRADMPKYNGFACGYGVHGKTKYDRCANKRALKEELDRER